jgi:uncharacterized membrane protein
MTKSLTIASLSSLAFFVVVDVAWLTNAVNFLFKPRIGHLLAEKPVLAVAVLFYLLYGVGMAFFALRPALAGNSVMMALGYGALLGLVAYGTYDLTNHATLKDWSPVVTIVDMTWGAFMTGVSCAFGVWVAQKFA